MHYEKLRKNHKFTQLPAHFKKPCGLTGGGPRERSRVAVAAPTRVPSRLPPGADGRALAGGGRGAEEPRVCPRDLWLASPSGTGHPRYRCVLFIGAEGPGKDTFEEMYCVYMISHSVLLLLHHIQRMYCITCIILFDVFNTCQICTIDIPASSLLPKLF